MKISPYAYGGKPRQVIHKEFTDPDEPGFLLTMDLRKLRVMEITKAIDTGNQMAALYVGQNGELPSQFLPPVAGEPVQVSESTCQVASIICTAQCLSREEDRYTWEEIISHMVRDSVCVQMGKTCEELQPDEVTLASPLAPKPSSPPSPPTPAGEEPLTTPPGSPTKPTPSGRSMSGSGGFAEAEALPIPA